MELIFNYKGHTDEAERQGTRVIECFSPTLIAMYSASKYFLLMNWYMGANLNQSIQLIIIKNRSR